LEFILILGMTMASLHPCKHSHVIKTLIDEAQKNGNKIVVEQYLFIFLKFINSVMPTLEIDFTTEIAL
jgi:ubiquitin-like-conjugating enzyme ATG3